MIRDVFNSIKVTLYERAASPLARTFILSWLMWNYRFVMIIFSELSVRDKFLWIDTYYSIYSMKSWGIGLIGPTAITAGFIFIYPYPANWVYQFWRKRQKELNELRAKIDDEEPMTKAEAKRLRSAHIELEMRYEEIIAGLKRSHESVQPRAAPPTLPKATKNAGKSIEMWENEFETFRRSSDFPNFKKQLGSILTGRKSISSIPMYSDFAAWGLVDHDEVLGGVYLTEKGKYFARLLKIADTEENKK